MFLKLPSINLSNFIVLLPLLLESLSIMCIVIIYFPVCGVTNIEINLRFLIKPFSTWPKKSEQKFEYVHKEKDFLGDTNGIFSQF